MKKLLFGIAVAVVLAAGPAFASGGDDERDCRGNNNCTSTTNNTTTNQGGQGGQGGVGIGVGIGIGKGGDAKSISDAKAKAKAEADAKAKATANAPTSIEGDTVRVYTSAPAVNPAALAAGMCGWGIGMSGSDGKTGAGLGFSKSFECDDFVRARTANFLQSMAVQTKDSRYNDAAILLLANNKETRKALIKAGLLVDEKKIAKDHKLTPETADKYEAVRPVFFPIDN